MIPTIALVGRPNVGKSTLFNRLTKTRDAIVANFAGLTRDRKYGDAEFEGKRFIVVDTGGISGDEEGIDSVMAEQSLQAIAESDIILFLVDCRDGLTHVDSQIAQHLRTLHKPTFLVANKVDGQNHDLAIAPFFELGLGEVHSVAAAHGRGVNTLMATVLADIAVESEADEADAERRLKMAIIGRPNVGKSTLVNRMLGEERVVVFDMPGTTRDSIYIDYERDEKHYTLIDTAGVRRRKNVKLTVEKFSIIKTLQAINDANVVILVMDASEGIVDQDLHLLGHAIESGRALVVALNKWDGLEDDHKSYVKTELQRRLSFVDYADLHFISALHGTGVGNLYKSVEQAYQAATEKYSTSFLTRILEDAVTAHQPPLVRGRRIKLRYAHAGGHNPPIIVIHGTQTSEVPNHYTRYLEKVYRRALELHGTPVRIEYRSGDNPFAGRKNKLTERQLTKKRRLMKHVKKKK
ncbi:ribosome biogenesis GTPase Der [Teredinibacter turnerae]|uniref:ribosome biogenesis GTPase Der n=1 Tax=Teredinibacter turnerae TaxID=2426 RepID=UPI0030D05B85